MTEPNPKNQDHFPLDEQQEKIPQPDISQPVAEPQKTHRSLWWVLGLLFGSVATLAALPYVPKIMVDQLRLPTHTVIKEVPAIPMVKKQAAATPAVDMQALQNIQTSLDSLEQRLNSFPPLKQGMQVLSKDLEILHQNQTRVHAAQISIETMQLHSRLSWVTNPSSHLPQMRLAWEEIVLLPFLDDTQHQQAKVMLALAEKRQNDVYHWQQALGRVIASYYYHPISSHNQLSDWLPSEGRFAPVSAWLIQQLHLQKAQHKDQAIVKLRQQLRSIQQNMSREHWPDAKLWMTLRSRLQLHLLHDDPSHQILTLPEDFSPIQSDIQRLRKTARDWLQESSK
ncbi:MAG: hypothetical protein Q9M15_05905 [Mariprofundaceae bacterium]|nr:hypothetical protein [Mariprofundaceae bacterium]